MAACNATTTEGRSCRRPASRGESFCAAHSPDPERHAAHAEASRAGGIARHTPEVSSIKAELRDIKAAIWSGRLSPGHATALLQALRLEREHDAAESKHAADNAPNALIQSIQSMRAANPPDLSEPGPANDSMGGAVETPPDPEPYDPDAPCLEDYRRADGGLDAPSYIRDSHAHRATPLGQLSVAERRKRWQSGTL